MRGALVVRLGDGTESARGQSKGRVEEVDTGEQVMFQSSEELFSFLGQSFEEALQRDRELNRPNYEACFDGAASEPSCNWEYCS
jgi:hypothetical protein